MRLFAWCAPIASTSGRSPSATASFSMWGTWRRSIGICCTKMSWERESFHPEFDRLFAFGIDPVGGGLPSDVPSDWPPLSAVQDYVDRSRAGIDEGLADGAPALQAAGRSGFSLETSAQRSHRASADACGDAGLHAASVAARTKRSGRAAFRILTQVRWSTRALRCLREWRHWAFQRSSGDLRLGQ